MIQYVTGDATEPTGTGTRIIAHVCNNAGGWGAGFSGAVSRKWKYPEQRYRLWYKQKTDFRLGEVQLTLAEPDLYVANMIAQSGYSLPDCPAIDYGALNQCLGELARLAEDRYASLRMPRIGTGLAAGSWDVIEPMIEAAMTGLSVTVYNLPEQP